MTITSPAGHYPLPVPVPVDIFGNQVSLIAFAHWTLETDLSSGSSRPYLTHLWFGAKDLLPYVPAQAIENYRALIQDHLDKVETTYDGTP